jgi:hypothetical protein
MNISKPTPPITISIYTLHPFFRSKSPFPLHYPATSFIMVAKRKDMSDLTTPAAPAAKKTRVSAAAAALATTPATTPKPVTETKVSAHTTMTSTVEVKTTKTNPSYGFGKPPKDEEIIKMLETCLNPGVPLHSLVHPEAAKLYEYVKVYSLLSRHFFR